MRRLLPAGEGSELDLANLWDAYAVAFQSAQDAPDRSDANAGGAGGCGASAGAVANMVCSLDGAATLRGRSGPLSSEADQHLFRLLRAQADAVVVGAGTVAVERYRRVRLPDELARLRVGAGLDGSPPLVVVSKFLALDLSAPPFSDPAGSDKGDLIVVTTPSASSDQVEAARRLADRVIVASGPDVPAEVTSTLAEMGLSRLLCEGGPRLLHSFMASGLISHLCLTVAPLITGAQGLALLGPVALDAPVAMAPVHLLEEGGWLFLLLRVLSDRTGGSQGNSP